MLGGALPSGKILLLAFLYSVGAYGIMTLNDIKSIRGDQQMGIRLLPVQLGPVGAARTACAIMVVPQIIVIALVLSWGEPLAAAVIETFLAIELAMMSRFLQARWTGRFGTAASACQ